MVLSQHTKLALESEVPSFFPLPTNSKDRSIMDFQGGEILLIAPCYHSSFALSTIDPFPQTLKPSVAKSMLKT